MTIHSENDHSEERGLEKQVEEMESRTFDIEFNHGGKSYKGWATPSGGKYENGKPKSFHVVLNDVFFGNLHRDDGTWTIDTQRETSLVQAAGKQIDDILS